MKYLILALSVLLTSSLALADCTTVPVCSPGPYGPQCQYVTQCTPSNNGLYNSNGYGSQPTVTLQQPTINSISGNF